MSDENIPMQIEILRNTCPNGMFIVKLFQPAGTWWCFNIKTAQEVLENLLPVEDHLVWDPQSSYLQPDGFFESIECLTEENEELCSNSEEAESEEDVISKIEQNKIKSINPMFKGIVTNPVYEFSEVILLYPNEEGLVNGIVSCIGVIVYNPDNKQRLGIHFVTGPENYTTKHKEEDYEIKKLEDMNTFMRLNHWETPPCILYLYKPVNIAGKVSLEAVQWSIRNIQQILGFTDANTVIKTTDPREPKLKRFPPLT